MKYVIERIKEPSTWAGISVLAASFGINIAPELWTPTVQALTGIAGVAAVLMREGV